MYKGNGGLDVAINLNCILLKYLANQKVSALKSPVALIQPFVPNLIDF